MQPAFDPYYRWLGIPPEEQPPNYYRLLGLRLFEASPDVIETAADRQMRHVHTFKAGQYSAQSQNLLNEIAGARLCLLAPAKKAEYDAALRAASPAEPPPLPPTIAKAPLAAAVPQAVAVAEAAPPAPLINTQWSASASGQAYRNRRSLAHSSGMMLAVGLAAIGVCATVAWLVWRSQPVAPQLPAVANQNLAEGQTLSLKLTPTGPHKPGELVFDVRSESPTGVQLDKANGDLTWTPEERQGPGTHRIRVRCSVVGSPHLFDEAAFDVVVTEVHQPPHLEPIELKASGNGAYSARLIGKDLDFPTKKPAYSLQIVPDPATAPKLNSEGVFSWRPAAADLGKTFLLTFRATKAGQPQAFSEQTVKVEIPTGPARSSERPPAPGTAQPGGEFVPDDLPITPQSRARLPMPDAPTQAEDLAKIKEIYAEGYKSKKAEDRLALARTLYAKALETGDSPSARYVLLLESSDLAAATGDVGQAWQALDRLSREFEFDAFEAKLATLKKAASSGRTSAADSAEAVQRYGELAEAAVREERFEAALELVQLASTAAGRLRDPSLGPKIQRRRTELLELKRAFEAAQGASDKLKESPDDPLASQRLGSYLCFWRNRWNEGLPLLAKSSSTKLAEAARLDIALPTKAEEQRAAGDAWLAAAEAERGLEREALVGRAEHWYRLALPMLPVFERNQLQKKLDSLPPRSGTTSIGALAPDA